MSADGGDAKRIALLGTDYVYPRTRDYQEFRVWGRTMPLKEPSYAATQTARHPG
jgi:hypothetical protein